MAVRRFRDAVARNEELTVGGLSWGSLDRTIGFMHECMAEARFGDWLFALVGYVTSFQECTVFLESGVLGSVIPLSTTYMCIDWVFLHNTRSGLTKSFPPPKS